MLERVRQALQTANLPGAGDILSTVWPHFLEMNHDRLTLNRPQLVDRFVQSLQAVGGEVLPVPDERTAREQIVELIRASNTHEVLAWPDEELPIPLAESLTTAGIMPMPIHLETHQGIRHLQLKELDRAVIGVTGAMAGLADTGSLALLSGAQRPMVTSLMPLIHIAILRERDIVPDMMSFLIQHSVEELTFISRNLVFITGPSRTADIEMILTRGVHGPKRLIVLLLAAEEWSTQV
jgi:L-lactate dehydrogenase complex protein LldG